jgi:hypothetical protein
MYKILIVYSQTQVKIYICIAVIEEDIYRTVLQRAGWAFPRSFLYLQFFSQ